MTEQRFSKSCRLLNANDFKPVFDKPDARVSHPCFLILAKCSEPNARLGLVVAKKQVKLANRRNRLKRLIRESFRCQSFKKSVDIIVLVRHSANDMDNKQLFLILNKQWQRLDKKLNAL